MWPFTRKPPVETKSLADPDSFLQVLFGAVPASSGVTVSGFGALQVPAVAAAVKVISESAACLDLKVVRIDGETETEEPDHPVATLLKGDVSDWMSGYELIRNLVALALVADHGGTAFVNWVNGRPVEILEYRPGVIQVDLTAPTGEPIFRIDGQVVPAQSVLHLRNLHDRCPVSMAREAIGIAIILERHVSKFFANGARPSGVLETPKSIGDAGITKLLAGWKAAQSGADNAGKTPILWDSTTYRPISFNSVDSQLLELRKHQIDEIARAFRVPPSMLWQLDRATWSNSEQMGKEFLTYSLEPWLRALEAALRRALFLTEDRARYAVRFDRDDLTRADLGARATAYASLIAARVINPNEARAWEGMEPYAGGDQFANPHTGASQPGAAAPQPANDGGRRAA